MEGNATRYDQRNFSSDLWNLQHLILHKIDLLFNDPYVSRGGDKEGEGGGRGGALILKTLFIFAISFKMGPLLH